MLRSFCLEPRVCRHSARLRRLQPALHRLYDGIARDIDFVSSVLGPAARHCAWSAHELEVHRRLVPAAEGKPTLLLPNSVYLQSDAAPPDDDFVLTVGNVQAGEPYQLQLVHDFQRAEHGERVEAGPLHAVCAALAAAARLVHPTGTTCVAILAKRLDILALRTRIDVRGVGERLRCEHGVDRILYVSIDDLAEATVDPTTRDLCVGPHRVSVVYVRYDFSHPFGGHVASSDARMHTGDAAHALRREWSAVEMMETSRAVISSSLGSRLAHRRRMQHAMVREVCSPLSHFLSTPDAAAVARVLPEQWALGPDASESERIAAAARIASAPEDYVAKSALRPRTGSGATQDRRATGGTSVETASGLCALLASPAAAWFLLYPKVRSVVHDASIVHAGEVHQLSNAATSEVAVFGAYLTAPPADGGEVLINEAAGLGVRTRPADRSHPLAAGLGYGALSCAAKA